MVLGDMRPACWACHRAKRKCSKGTPCARCEKQKTICVYGRPDEPEAIQSGPATRSDPEDVSTSIDVGDDDFAMLSPGTAQLVNFNLAVPTSATDAYCGSWFLAPETFLIDHSPIRIPPNFNMSDLNGFMKNVQAWFETWAKTGSNLFIHHALYADRLPPCVSMAFSTLSAYLNKTPQTACIMLRALNDRAAELTASIEKEDLEALDTIELIARVHALLTYEVIGLLDGDPRARHIAEQHAPSFIKLLTRLLDKASTDIRRTVLEAELLDLAHTSSSASGFVVREWRAWVVSESVRRTWLLGTGLMAAYDGLKTGWTSCGGDLACTNREGLWTAKGAHAWSKLCANVDVRFIGRFRAEWLFECPTEEIDDFAKMMLEITYGKDRMAAWIES